MNGFLAFLEPETLQAKGKTTKRVIWCGSITQSIKVEVLQDWTVTG